MTITEILDTVRKMDKIICGRLDALEKRLNDKPMTADAAKTFLHPYITAYEAAIKNQNCMDELTQIKAGELRELREKAEKFDRIAKVFWGNSNESK